MTSFRFSLSIPWAIVAAGGILGGAIIMASVIAPYRIAGSATGAWRVNAITGEVQICELAFRGCRSPIFP